MFVSCFFLHRLNFTFQFWFEKKSIVNIKSFSLFLSLACSLARFGRPLNSNPCDEYVYVYRGNVAIASVLFLYFIEKFFKIFKLKGKVNQINSYVNHNFHNEPQSWHQTKPTTHSPTIRITTTVINTGPHILGQKSLLKIGVGVHPVRCYSCTQHSRKCLFQVSWNRQISWCTITTTETSKRNRI